MWNRLWNFKLKSSLISDFSTNVIKKWGSFWHINVFLDQHSKKTSFEHDAWNSIDFRRYWSYLFWSFFLMFYLNRFFFTSSWLMSFRFSFFLRTWKSQNPYYILWHSTAEKQGSVAVVNVKLALLGSQYIVKILCVTNIMN